MRAVERPSRYYSFQKEIESMIVFLQPTTDLRAKKERIRIIFCNHRVISPLRQLKYLKRAEMCINESYRPPYLNSFLVTSPA